MFNFKNFLPLLSLVYIVSCSTTSTRLTGSWVSSDHNQNYDNVLVVAMTDKPNVKQVVENNIANQLQAKGVAAAKSIDVFPPRFTEDQLQDKEYILNAVREKGHNAILTVALIDEDTETRYVPGNTAYAPMRTFSYYGNFWGYYSNLYPTMYDPGYYRQDKVYFVETNLYDADSEELIWSAQTETLNPSSLESASEELAEITVEKMIENNLF